MNLKLKNKGLLEMFFATFIWGSIPVVSVWANMPSPIFVFFRVVFAFPFVFFYALKNLGIKELLRVKPGVSLLISGIILALNWIFFFWALSLTNVMIVVVLYYSGPMYTIILSVIFLKERLTKFFLLSVLIAFIGIIFTFSSGFGNLNSLTGLILAFISGVLYGLLGFISKLATLHHKPSKVTTYQTFISIFFTLPFVFIFPFTLDVKTIMLLLLAGTVHTALALFLWYDSLNYIKVSTASVFSYLDPLFATILGFLFLHQLPSSFQLVGGALILFAGIIASRQEKSAAFS